MPRPHFTFKRGDRQEQVGCRQAKAILAESVAIAADAQ
jgi:hypothetical protein